MSAVGHLEVLVEEPSMELALRQLLPKMLGSAITFEIYAFQCKSQMLSKLAERLQGYARWLPPDWRIVVVLDRDDDPCLELKRRLVRMAEDAGLKPKTPEAGVSYQVVHRIAVEELEAWFFGDPQALRAAYPRLPAAFESKRPYRTPDLIQGGTWEALQRLLQKAGYFESGLRKLELAREVSRRMEPERNTSPSFRVFRAALEQLRAASDPRN